MQIRYYEDKYGERQRVTLVDTESNRVLVDMSTHSDCAEDNTISRMGLPEILKELVEHFTDNTVSVVNLDWEDY